MKTSFFRRAVVWGAAVLLAACSGKEEAVAPASKSLAAAAQSVPAVAVTVVPAQRRDFVQEWRTSGTVTPLASVAVRPQVSSVVRQVHFREGDFVPAGALLFTLDDRSDAANVRKAQAQLTKDEAALADAQRQLERSRQLLAQNFVSPGSVDTASAAVQAQLALVVAAQAALEAARVSQSYARVTAPWAGRAGSINVSPGSTVLAHQTTLVTLTQLDPMAISFSLPQRDLPVALAGLQGAGAVVSAQLPGSPLGFRGHLQFVDNVVDANAGTLQAKAVFENPKHLLWPGAFVEVRLVTGVLQDAVVIPHAAVIQSARGSVVYVVEGGKAQLVPVQLQAAQQGLAAVSGLAAGAQVVLEGRQNLRPGVLVVVTSNAPTAPIAP
jgi:RND family efflux transporter MFP subunit